MVADGLSIINADFSSTSFRVSRASIGAHNFLGNHIAYPSQGKTGDNCLLATKVMVPIDGKVREGVGLLGSPSFEIPRTVERDSRFDHLTTEDGAAPPPRRQEQAQPRHHGAVPAGRGGSSSSWLTLLGLAAADLYRLCGASAIALATVAHPAVHRRLLRARRTCRRPGSGPCGRSTARSTTATSGGTSASGSCLRRRTSQALQRHAVQERDLAAAGCPDRHAGSSTTAAGMTEKTLVTHRRRRARSTPGSVIQCHSQEDGAFKSDRITIGAGCTLGVGAFVHYGVTIGDGAVLAPDSFLMKGEEVPPHAQWGGNPAREMRADHPGDRCPGARPASSDRRTTAARRAGRRR